MIELVAPTHVPYVVRQVSRNIRPVYPAPADGAQVVAYWENAEGKRQSDPA